MRNRHTLIYSNIDYLVLWGMLFLPFDALRFFPIPMTYRPMGALFIALYAFFHYILKNKFKVRSFIYFVICLLSVFVTGMMCFYFNLKILSLIKFIFTLFLGLFSFFGLCIYFNKLISKNNLQTAIDIFCDIYVKAMLIPLIFGLIQLVQIILHVYPLDVVFNTLSYRYTNSRVCLSASEPAGAAEYLLLLLVILFCGNYQSRRNNAIKIITVVLFLATFSMKGFILLFMLYFVYTLPRMKPLKVITAVFVIIGSFYCIFFLSTLNAYLNSRMQFITGFVSEIFRNRDIFFTLLPKSDSAFIRIGNPIIGFMMAMDHPLLGSGGGYFYRFYPEYIYNFFPTAVNNVEVYGALHDGSEITSRSLFVRFFAENGLLFGCMFLFFILSLYRKAISNKFLSVMISLAICYSFFQDSLCYQPFIYIVSFVFVCVGVKHGKAVNCNDYI